MKNNFTNNVNYIYNHNIEDVIKYKEYASPNTFIISSYNYNIKYNYDNYVGISYELYYINNDKNIQQLTYNIIEGNGISLKDNKISINIDNNTITSFYDKNTKKNYLKVNTQNFKSSSYLNNGIVGIDNELYYNDNYVDSISLGGNFRINQQIELSTGLLSDLQSINNYYKLCIDKMKDIEYLYNECLKKIGYSILFKVGDILYYDSDTKLLSFSKHNQNGEENIPYMICVISSNILPDCQPRFIPITRNNSKYIFDKTSSFYVKSAYAFVSNYITNKLSDITIDTEITNSTYGFIATNNSNWINNYENPFNEEEHYYANIPQLEKYDISYIEIQKQQPIEATTYSTNTTTTYTNTTTTYTNTSSTENNYTDLYYTSNWYCDSLKVNLSNYNIQPYGIFTDLINNNLISKYNNQDLTFLFSVKYSNGITKKYKCKFDIENRRLLNKNVLSPYDSINEIVNNTNSTTNTTGKLDSLQKTYTQNNNNCPITYISCYDTSRNVNILSNTSAVNVYDQYGSNNDWWYRDYNMGNIGERVGSYSKFLECQYIINQCRVNLKIDSNLCQKDCYLKVSLTIIRQKIYPTLHSEYFIKYDNANGIHYVLADVNSNTITDSATLDISFYQMGDFSDKNPHTLSKLNIISNSDIFYGYGGIIINCHIKSSIYGFQFKNISQILDITNVYKNNWLYNNDITKYLTLINYGIIIKDANINALSNNQLSEYYINFDKCICYSNNQTYYKPNYTEIHIHPQGIVINLNNILNNYNWKQYDIYYIDFTISYLQLSNNINSTDVNMKYYKSVKMGLMNNCLYLADKIFIPKTKNFIKFTISDVYVLKNNKQENITQYFNLPSQGTFKNISSCQKYMNYN